VWNPCLSLLMTRPLLSIRDEDARSSAPLSLPPLILLTRQHILLDEKTGARCSQAFRAISRREEEERGRGRWEGMEEEEPGDADIVCAMMG